MIGSASHVAWPGDKVSHQLCPVPLAGSEVKLCKISAFSSVTKQKKEQKTKTAWEGPGPEST